MAAEIEIINGVAQHVYVGDTPWHGLGTRVPADLSPEQMLKAAHLDWKVEKRPLFYQSSRGLIKSKSEVLVRDLDEKVLTTVSDGWNPVQNSEAFDFFDDFVRAGNMQMHTAGSLKGGQIVWALAEIKDSFELFGGDKVDGYLLFTNPHKFGQAIDVRFTAIRVVCQNTLTMALNDNSARSVKINHRSHFDADRVKETLGIAHDKLMSFRAQAEFLGSKRFTEETLKEYFQKVFPSASKKEKESRLSQQALEVVHTQPGANFAEGSWWTALNTTTYLVDHLAGRSDSSRLASAWYGAGKNTKDRALELAVEFAEAA